MFERLESKSGKVDGCFKKGDTVVVNIKLPTPVPTQEPTQAPAVAAPTQKPIKTQTPAKTQAPASKKKRSKDSTDNTESLIQKK